MVLQNLCQTDQQSHLVRSLPRAEIHLPSHLQLVDVLGLFITNQLGLVCDACPLQVFLCNQAYNRKVTLEAHNKTTLRVCFGDGGE